MKLTNPTTQELSNAVAEFVAGWHFLQAEKDTGPFKVEIHGWFNSQGFYVESPVFASSVADVLPLLEREPYGWRACRSGEADGKGEYSVVVYGEGSKTSCAEGRNLAHTACVALLRAHGHEVI